MHRNFQGALADPEPAGRGGLIAVGRFANQPGLEARKILGFPLRDPLTFQRGESSIKDGQCPLTVKEFIRRQFMAISQDDGRRCIVIRVERSKNSSATALLPSDPLAFPCEEMFQSPEQIAPEFSLRLSSAFERWLFEQPSKKLMRHFAGGILVPSFPAQKGNHGFVIGRA